MSTIFELDPAQTRVLNAKRYGLSADDLDRFTEIMTAQREKRAAEAGEVSEEETDAQRAERIKDYLVDRISSSLSSIYQPEDQPQNPTDMMLELMSPRDDKGTDWSGLLNMHFDLDTLQMLNKS